MRQRPSSQFLSIVELSQQRWRPRVIANEFFGRDASKRYPNVPPDAGKESLFAQSFSPATSDSEAEEAPRTDIGQAVAKFGGGAEGGEGGEAASPPPGERHKHGFSPSQRGKRETPGKSKDKRGGASDPARQQPGAAAGVELTTSFGQNADAN